MKEVQAWQLGQTSAWYETRGQGAGTISTGKGDLGGVSYGEFQLSSTSGTLREYLDQSKYKADFKGLSAATPAFDQKWEELAKEEDFGRDQYDYIKRTHYDRQVEALKQRGLNLTGRGPAVQDALWSTAVQTGGRTVSIFEEGLKEKFGNHYSLPSLADKDIVEAVQDYKYNHTETLFRHSKAQWHGLKERALQEKADLVQLAETGVAVDAVARTRQRAAGAHHHHHHHGDLRIGAHGKAVYDLQIKLGQLGYTDGYGKPLHADKDFGPSTKGAVEAFQRTHELKPDGIAGTETLRVLAAHTQPLSRAERRPSHHGCACLDDPQHPDHAFYLQTRTLVHQLDREHGRMSDQHSDNLASALTVAARASGLSGSTQSR